MRKVENRLTAVFWINATARGGRIRGPRAGPLMNHPRQRKCPLDSSRLGDSRLSARTDSGFHAADRLEVAELGADLSNVHVQ